MALKFHPLKVKKVIKETEDTVSIEFEISEDLKETFSYKHGQYVTIKAPFDNADERRAYSICSSPVETDNITVAIKKADDGYVSKYLNDELKEGDVLDVMPPLGNFTIELNQNNNKHYVMFGGGSGITPLMSIMTTVLKVEKDSKITLYYSSRYENSIIFDENIKKLKDTYSDRFDYHYIISRPKDDWSGLKGRIDEQLVSDVLDNKLEDINNIEYFLCGHPGMMNSIENAFEKFNIPKDKIHKESFTVELPKEVQNADTNDKDFSEDDLITRKVKIILYNEEHEFDVEPDETILTAAQREGYDPPFSCQIGACSTCRAKIESGNIYMEEHDALTDMEIEEGYVLTCQAHPISDDVVVNYDEY